MVPRYLSVLRSSTLMELSAVFSSPTLHHMVRMMYFTLGRSVTTTATATATSITTTTTTVTTTTTTVL